MLSNSDSHERRGERRSRKLDLHGQKPEIMAVPAVLLKVVGLTGWRINQIIGAFFIAALDNTHLETNNSQLFTSL